MRVFKIIAVILLIVAAFVWYSATTIAERAIRQYLEAHEIPVQSLTVSGVGPRYIKLTDVVLGENGTLGIAGAHFEFQYLWAERRFGDLHARLRHVHMNGLIQNGRLTLGGVERFWSNLVPEKVGNAITLELDGDVELMRDRSGKLSASYKNGDLVLKQHGEHLIIPLELEGSATGTVDALTFKGNFHDTAKQLSGIFSGDYTISSKKGTVHWDTEQVEFDPEGFTFAKLSPAFAEGVPTYDSTLSLNGKATLNGDIWTIQPEVKLHRMPVEAILEQVLGEGTRIAGNITGEVPFRLTKGGTWRLSPSTLKNLGEMEIHIAPDANTAAMLKEHPQSDIVIQALSNLQVSELTLKVESTDSKGGVKMTWHFLGRNPDFLQGKPVDLTLAVTANLRDIWRSAEQVKALEVNAQKLLKSK